MGQNCDGTFTEIRRIVARDVDMNNKLKMSAAFAIVQETANAQCAEFGCGWNDLMAKYNACYVLTRMRFEIKKHPAAGDDVVIRTWPNKNIKAIFTRYFTIEDTEGNLYGSGVSQWALFNVVKRAVTRPSECNIVLPEVTSREEPFALPKGALYSNDVFENAEAVKSVRIPSYDDFDYNRHVNNAKYVEWVEETLPIEFFAQGRQISVIDIKYKHEISFDEFMKKTENERTVTMECTSVGDGEFCVRSILQDGSDGIQCYIK